MVKKVDFGVGRPSDPAPNANIDQWVEDRDAGVPEPTKRFTIDVPISLHKRIKSQCALQNLVMAEVIRDLLEKRFPKVEQGPPS